MRDPCLSRPRALLVGLALLGACADQATPEAGAPGPDESPPPGQTSAASTETTAAAPTKTDASPPWNAGPLASLRPTPWTGWPLEHVDIEAVAGWRINPTSGAWERVDGLRLRCDPDELVLAIADGEVAALERDEADHLFVVVDHGQGIDSRIGPLAEAGVHERLPVTRGASLGLAAGRSLELQVRVDGIDIDPLQALRQPLQRWPALLQRLPPPPAPAPAPAP